ncbi:MAG: T9SS type A sorting domain-containing protein [Ignavibacteriaceae bacterium]|nr:T9SS type A sorting domain-containing protein [Ignavibacteriaceae bacterium]
MKSLVTTALVMLMVTLFAASNRTFAASDTLNVYASDSRSLEIIIGSDTTTGGLQAHKAYKLVSLDTTYIYFGAITIKSNFTLIGALGLNNRPPCVQPAILQDGSMPANLFTLNATGINVLYKNLYFLGTSSSNTNDVADFPDAIRVPADSIRLTLDNVVFEAWYGDAVTYSGNWDKFYITNCKFRNLAQPSWYSGEVLRNGWPGTAYTDTVEMKYNTVFCVNAYAACTVTKSLVNYFDFSHNSVVWMFKNPLWLFNLTNAKVDDNIFYGVFAGNSDSSEYLGQWDEPFSFETPCTIDLDTLTKSTASDFGVDTSKSNWRTLAEAKRTIEVKNNVYFTPAALSSYLTAWNDTATVDKIVLSPWMNNRTTKMFADKTTWPGLVESGNQNVDPGYGSSILDVLYSGKGDGMGLLDYIKAIRTNVTTTDWWGYQLTQVGSSENWVPTWPLPESADMQYSNSALKTAGTDGKAIGDPGWFTNGFTGVTKTTVTVPGTFSLSNAYPNPFNPTTNIKFAVAKSENITLVVFNLLGQKVKTLVNGMMKVGDYTATWDGKDEFGKSVASGIYFYRFESQSFTSTKKMILMK